jgi:hypothetical protein
MQLLVQGSSCAVHYVLRAFIHRAATFQGTCSYGVHVRSTSTATSAIMITWGSPISPRHLHDRRPNFGTLRVAPFWLGIVDQQPHNSSLRHELSKVNANMMINKSVYISVIALLPFVRKDNIVTCQEFIRSPGTRVVSIFLS